MKKILSLVLVICGFDVCSMEDPVKDDVVRQGLNFQIGDILLTPVDTESGNVEEFKKIYSEFVNQYDYKLNPDLLAQRSDERKVRNNPWRLYLAKINDISSSVQFGICPNCVDQKNPFVEQIEKAYVKAGVGEYNNGIYKPCDISAWGHILPMISDNIDVSIADKFISSFIELAGYFATNGFVLPYDKIAIGISFHLHPNDRLVEILGAKEFNIISPDGVDVDSWLYPNGPKRIMLFKMFK